MVEQHVEIAVVPAGGVGRPGAFETAGHAVAAQAAFDVVHPAQALLCQIGPLGGRTQVGGIAVAVALADRMAASGQGDGLLIVHCHAGEGHAHVVGGLERIGLAIHAFRIDVDQAHHHRGQGIFQVALAGITGAFAAAGRQPLLLGTPVDVLFRMPDVLAAKGETVGLQPHGFIGDIAGEDDQVRPTELVAVLFLDGPQQPARLVQVGVIRPAIDGGEALIARTGATATVGDAIGARGMPGHADHQTAIVTPVGWPPVLAVGHQIGQVLLDRGEVEFLHLFTVVETGTHGVGLAVVLMQDVEIQRLWPPVHVRGTNGRVTTMHHRAFTGSRRSGSHSGLQSWLRDLSHEGRDVSGGAVAETQRDWGGY